MILSFETWIPGRYGIPGEAREIKKKKTTSPGVLCMRAERPASPAHSPTTSHTLWAGMLRLRPPPMSLKSNWLRPPETPLQGEVLPKFPASTTSQNSAGTTSEPAGRPVGIKPAHAIQSPAKQHATKGQHATKSAAQRCASFRFVAVALHARAGVRTHNLPKSKPETYQLL